MIDSVRTNTLVLGFFLFTNTVVLADEKGLPDGYRETGAQQTESFSELCEATADTGLFSGAVLVGVKGKVVYKHAFGSANREWHNANTTDTKFRLASVSKPFCAIVVLQLVQEGKLRLEDNICDWLPNYRNDTGKKITIHHLLSHQSGIKDFTAGFNYRGSVSRLPFAKDEFIEKYCSNDLMNEPGTIYAYCNAGYVILGRVVEKVTRKSFEQNVQERIFVPLEMNDSGYDRNRYVLSKRASNLTRAIAF
jgi:CubicO group peptidase (beta-lactamase class C family)